MDKAAFFQAVRSGIMGPTLNVLPSFAAPNSANSGVVNSSFFGDHGTASCVATDRQSLLTGQFRVDVFPTNLRRSMRYRVGRICARVSPIKVLRDVIKWVSITVANHRSRQRWRSNKGERDQSMHSFRLSLSVPTNGNLSPTRTANSLCEDFWPSPTTIPNRAFHASQIRNGIIWRTGNLFPYFVSFHTGIGTMKPNALQVRGRYGF